MKKTYTSIFLLFCLSFLGSAVLAQNVVTDWASIIQPAVLSNGSGGARSPGTAEILHATIQLAMYDAAMAIEGGYAPFAANLPAPAGADVRAAVATAAYQTALARVAPSQDAYLNAQYATYMMGIPDG